MKGASLKLPKIRSTRAKALSASPSVVEAVQDRRTNFFVRLGGSNANENIVAAFERGQSASYGWLYMHRPAVRTVVDYIARNIAQLPLKLYDRVDDINRERRDDHAAAQLMHYPDDRTPMNQWIFQFVADWLVYDNAYAVKFRPPAEGGRLVLQRVPPYLVTVRGGRFTPVMYRVWRFDGTWLDVPPEDMIHFKGYNPDDPLIGISRLETLRDTLTEDQVSQATTVDLMKNGLKGGHIERPLDAPEWTDEALKRFQESWANQRTSSPRRDPVLEEGMKWVPTALSPKDAELLAGRRFTVEEVSRIYGVHPRVLGLSEGGSSTELQDLRQQVYTDTLPPITLPLASQFDYCLLLEEFFEKDMYFEFDLNEKLRGDPEKRFAAITSAVGRPWMLVDEARALENRAPVEGGDELTIPLNVALGSLPAPNVMPPQDPNKPPQDGSHRTDELPSSSAGELEIKAGDSGPRLLAATNSATESTPPRYVERALLVLLDRYFTRQAKSGARKSKFNAERWNRELSDDLYVLLREVVARESGTTYDQLGPDDSALKNVAVGTAEGVNEFVQHELAEHPSDRAFARIKDRNQQVAGHVAVKAVEMAMHRMAGTELGPSLAAALEPPPAEHPALADRDRLERLRLLRELALPDEVIWELAGFTQDEIDHMRRLNHASGLLAGANSAGDVPIP